MPRILASEWDEATSAINRHLPNANTIIGSAGPNLVLNDTNALHQVSLTLSEHELPCQKMTAANISKLITMVKVPSASKFPQKFAEWCDADQDQISQAQNLIKNALMTQKPGLFTPGYSLGYCSQTRISLNLATVKPPTATGVDALCKHMNTFSLNVLKFLLSVTTCPPMGLLLCLKLNGLLAQLI